MLRPKKQPGIRDTLTDEEKKYIFENHSKTTVLKMAAHLQRGVHAIYDYMDQQHLQVYTTRPELKKHRTPVRVKAGYFDVSSMKHIF